ncbi:MAG TPA: SDR family oxidoreductase [Polyangiaceae bacterium]|nr:SDR family oxidoreductase [Polyangiaceae bacterium]
MSEHILITGGDGYVGLRTARAYLEETDAQVTLVLRARDAEEAENKRNAVALGLWGVDLRRVSYVHDDITGEAPFAEVDPKGITAIVHAAAVTRFNVERPLAESVNVEGAKKLLAFADRCPKLESFGLLSTVYSCGLLPGTVSEVPARQDHGFANHYEWSKWAAETSALEAYSHLPLRIIRIATLFADGDTGQVTQFNAFHNTLKLYFYGLLSLVPGKLDTPVYLVAGDFVTRSVFRLVRSKSAKGIYHVAHEREHNPTLGELISQVFDIYEANEEFRRKRILRPLFTDDESFEILAETVDTFAGAVTRQALQSMTPFARQLYVHKTLSNTRMQAELGDYQPPNYRAQLARTVENLIDTKWGRHSPKITPVANHPERTRQYAV